jgi:hypothetical protein
MEARADDLASGALKAEVLALIKRERPALSPTETGEPETIGIGEWTLGLSNLFRRFRQRTRSTNLGICRQGSCVRVAIRGS